MTATNPFNLAPALAQALALPASAYVGQRIAKTLLIEQIANLPGSTAADKRLVNQLLAELHWMAALKPATCGLAAWQTDTHDYLEIAVLHAMLYGSSSAAPAVSANRPNQLTRLIELIHRTIPYPVVLIVSQPGADGSGNVEQLSLAHKRLSAGNSSAMVLEQAVTTKSIAPYQRLTGATGQFVHYLAFNQAPNASTNASTNASILPIHDLYARYGDWLHAAEALAASEYTGQFTVSATAPDAARRRSALAAYEQLSQQLTSLRAQACKESQLGQRATLNLKIAQGMAERQALLSQL